MKFASKVQTSSLSFSHRIALDCRRNITQSSRICNTASFTPDSSVNLQTFISIRWGVTSPLCSSYELIPYFTAIIYFQRVRWSPTTTVLSVTSLTIAANTFHLSSASAVTPSASSVCIMSSRMACVLAVGKSSRWRRPLRTTTWLLLLRQRGKPMWITLLFRRQRCRRRCLHRR